MNLGNYCVMWDKQNSDYLLTPEMYEIIEQAMNNYISGGKIGGDKVVELKSLHGGTLLFYASWIKGAQYLTAADRERDVEIENAMQQEERDLKGPEWNQQ